MSNEIFNIVAGELETHLGDILGIGITKKSLQKIGSSPDMVTPQDMKKALKVHIFPALQSFMSKEKAYERTQTILRKIRESETNA